MSTNVKGYILGAIAAATYGLNPLFSLPLYNDGMDADSVLFFRYLLALPIIAVMLIRRGRSFILSRGEILPMIAMGILFALSSLTLFESYNYMYAGIATTLLFIYPIIVALIMTVLYHEKLTVKTIICLVITLSGVLLLYKNADGVSLSLVGTFLVIGSALSYAIYLVGINRPNLKSVPTITVTFYVILIGWIMFASRILVNETGLLYPTRFALWGNLLASAIFPTVIALVCTTKAILYIGSTPTAILGALEPVTAVIIGIAVFNETLTIREFIGLLLIIGAVTVVVAGGNISLHLVRFRKLFPKLPMKRKKEK